jgi:hypothetical protein
MEMNFPHLDIRSDAQYARRDYRAYLAKAISHQGNSPTARAMLSAMREPILDDNVSDDTIESRIHYFAAALFPITAETAPYGAFLPCDNTEFSNSAIYDQAVYQDGLGDGKLDAIFSAVSELQKTKLGQEN